LKDERQKKSRCVKAWLRKHRLRFSWVIVQKAIRETHRMRRIKRKN